MERAATTASSFEAEQDSATARTSANGEVELTATIDGQVKTITEASLRRHLKLKDNGSVTTLPNLEIFEQLALMGYVTDSDKLTFQKGHFFSLVEGRSLIKELDMDAGISLVPQHAANEGRNDDTQIYDQPAERRRSVSIGSGRVSTASRTVSTTDVSTASELGSTVGVKAKDKGKAIMQEFEPPKKVKKRVQVQMSMDEELAKKVFEEEQAKAMAEQEQERISFEEALELQK
ncbi:hypothetical protein Tco_1046401 [Tanacetum coccineum]